MRGYRRIYRAIFPHVLLIHTPKCGGTYVRTHYQIASKSYIRDVGHATLRDFTTSRRTRVVGFIRDPMDWYASYYYFRVRGLKAAPATLDNFPPNHPVSVFSGRDGGLPEMIRNMSSPDFIDSVRPIVASIYMKDAPDLFSFMRRTQTGFWTWTMIHHFSRHRTADIAGRLGVIRAANEIAKQVSFIRQESIDEDVARILKLRAAPGSRINVSERADAGDQDGEAARAVAALDGEVAMILGGYHLQGKGPVADAERSAEKAL
jgi:hypothetical protein